MCVAVHMIYTVNLYSSVLILAFISMDRYLAVVRATNSQGPRKLLANRIIYVGVWLPARAPHRSRPWCSPKRRAALSAPSASASTHRRLSQPGWSFSASSHILVGFVLPGLVILICYCIIISKLSRGSKGTQKRKALKTPWF